MSRTPSPPGRVVDGAPHGTLTGYQNWRCRCSACRAARRRYDRAREGRQRPEWEVMHERIIALLRGGRRMTLREVAEHLNADRDMVCRRLSQLRDGGRIERDERMFAWAPEWYCPRPPGRTCAHPGCGTILSRYNPDDYCALHLPDHIEWEEAA